MFNTKRIEENVDVININFKFLKESLTKLEDIVGANASKFNDLIDWKNSLIPCSTCKCLIKKEDAIRGKSEVDNKIYQFHELECDIKYEVVYESAITNKPIGFNKLLINTPYYCHSKDCKPKK